MSVDCDFVFQPFEILRFPYTFIDGGLAANCPLWAFDGWYLSMKKEDTFQERLTVEEGQMVRRMFHPENRKERFDTRNDKTLGILLEAVTKRPQANQTGFSRSTSGSCGSFKLHCYIMSEGLHGVEKGVDNA
ncbi:hypothetical protein Bbelb_111230 [Branchiostoma belcheri]|nr:hypothetical protein Bbelb_111230 [Branchiostoma belcheri]